MKKINLVLLSLLVLSLPVKAAEKELKFWHFWPESWMQPAIEAFEKENPGVKIAAERLTWADGFNKIITAMAANQAPDVIEVGSTWVAGMSADGGLKTIDPGNLRQRLINWEPAQYKGRFYAVPWTVSTAALYYNKSLMRQVGVSVPKTWSELLKASTAIHGIGEEFYGYGVKTGTYSTWQKFMPFAWSMGSRIINAGQETSGVADPGFIEAVSFYKKLRDVGLYDENTNVRKAFRDGKLGFMIEEPGQVQKFAQEVPDLDFGVMPLPPSRLGKSVHFAGGQMLAITKNAKHVSEAQKLIKFMVRPENTKAITYKITTLFPADKTASKDAFYTKDHPELMVFLSILKTATSPYAHPLWIDIQEEFSEQLERVMYEKETPEDAMRDAKDEIEDLLQEG